MNWLRSIFYPRTVIFFGSAWTDRDVDIYFGTTIDFDELLFGPGER